MRFLPTPCVQERGAQNKRKVFKIHVVNNATILGPV